MKKILLFGLLVALAVYLLINIVNISQTILDANFTPSLNNTASLDAPSSLSGIISSSSIATTRNRYDCRRQCAWQEDDVTHQFLETNQDPANSLQHVILSTEGYGRLADLALGYHLSSSESDMLRNITLMQECLPRRVLIIYFYTDKPQAASFRQLDFIHNLTRPHVIITNGWGNIWKRHRERKVINNPYLIRWYGSSQERSQDTWESSFHNKAYPLPVGLVAPINRFEQVKPMVQINQELKQSRTSEVISQPNMGRMKLVLINFSINSEKAVHRATPYNLFCNTSHPTYNNEFGRSSSNQSIHITTCANGGFYDRKVLGRRRRYFAGEWNDMALSVYRDWSNHKYTVSPRGQQKDCHRFWEAMYLGSVPIVLRKDGYYQDLVEHYFQLPEEELPILFVQRWKQATPELLEKMWDERFVHLLRKPEWQWPQRRLTTDYVQELIVRGIRDELQQRNDSVAEQLREMVLDPSTLFGNRRRCYAPKEEIKT